MPVDENIWITKLNQINLSNSWVFWWSYKKNFKGFVTFKSLSFQICRKSIQLELFFTISEGLNIFDKLLSSFSFCVTNSQTFKFLFKSQNEYLKCMEISSLSETHLLASSSLFPIPIAYLLFRFIQEKFYVILNYWVVFARLWLGNV